MSVKQHLQQMYGGKTLVYQKVPANDIVSHEYVIAQKLVRVREYNNVVQWCYAS